MTASLPQTPSGSVIDVNVEITKETDVVPMRKDIAFGFEWKAEGLPPLANIVYRVEHPKVTMPDGKSRSSIDEPIAIQTREGVLQTIDCFRLPEGNELVPGEWSLAVLHGGSTLVKKAFQVVRDRE